MFEIVYLRDEISLNLLLKRAVGFGGSVEKPRYTEFVFFSVKCCGVPGARVLFQWGAAGLGQHQHQAPCGFILLRCPRPISAASPRSCSDLLPPPGGCHFFPFSLLFSPFKGSFRVPGCWRGRAGEDADPAHAASLSSAPRQFVSCNGAVEF